MKVSVIIPNYNGERILSKNLHTIRDSIVDSNVNSEIIICDDNSSDSSVEIIKEFIEKNSSKVRVVLVTANENKGFATNVNRGVKRSTGEILVLLNTDVIPSRNFLGFLLSNFDDENVFAVGCMDESVEGEKVILRGRGKGKWERGFLVHSAASIDGYQSLWVSGGSGAFRKTIWDKLGGLDSIYDPFYWEDIDLSYRARKSGYITVFEEKSVVRHEHEKGVIKTKYKYEQVKRIVYRNQFIFAWKNSDFSTLISGVFWLPYHLISALISGDWALILGFFYGSQKVTRSF